MTPNTPATPPIWAQKVSPKPTNSLKPHASNARTHSERQMRQIAASIEAFGWTNPIHYLVRKVLLPAGIPAAIHTDERPTCL